MDLAGRELPATHLLPAYGAPHEVAALDARPGICSKGPRISVPLAGFARVAVSATWKEVLSCVMDLADWEFPAL